MTTAANGSLVVMATPTLEGIPSISPSEAGLSDAAASDMLHQERMEYIKQLVQEREKLSNGVGCDVAKKLIEQGRNPPQSFQIRSEGRQFRVVSSLTSPQIGEGCPITVFLAYLGIFKSCTFPRTQLLRVYTMVLSRTWRVLQKGFYIL